MEKKSETKKTTEELKETTKKEIFMEKNNKIFYGDSSLTVSVGVMDYNDFVKQTKKDQIMPSFDPKYRDFVDYIIKITHEIWEERKNNAS